MTVLEETDWSFYMLVPNTDSIAGQEEGEFQKLSALHVCQTTQVPKDNLMKVMFGPFAAESEVCTKILHKGYHRTQTGQKHYPLQAETQSLREGVVNLHRPKESKIDSSAFHLSCQGTTQEDMSFFSLGKVLIGHLD